MWNLAELITHENCTIDSRISIGSKITKLDELFSEPVRYEDKFLIICSIAPFGVVLPTKSRHVMEIISCISSD
jgi:hypothetical protein